MDYIREKLIRFERPGWLTTPARKIEATLCQIEVLKRHELELGKEPSRILSIVESRLRDSRTVNCIAFVQAREIISKLL